MRRWGPLLGWLGSLVAGIVLFTVVGSGPLEAPPLGQPSAWGDWAAARDPFVAVAAVLRLVVLALAWYLVAVTTVGLVARLTRAARLVRIADALSIPVVRHVLRGALGLTLAAGVVASSSGTVPASARAAPGPSPTATAVAVGPDERPGRDTEPSGHDTERMVELGPPGASTRASDEDAPQDVEARGEDGSKTGPAPDPEADDAPVAAAGEHEVVAGEHLWSIAADHLAAHLDHDASEAEVAAHWRRLIEANRDRLANPDDPDLIFPGQRFVLPEVRPVDGT